jgi:RIO kinase 2
MEEKLRNIRLGNTEPFGSDLEESEEEEESKEEEEEEQVYSEKEELARRSEKIEKLNNRDYKAHRDPAAKPKDKETQMKDRVARTLKSESNRGNYKQHVKRNTGKGKAKRKDKEATKGGSIFD